MYNFQQGKDNLSQQRQKSKRKTVRELTKYNNSFVNLKNVKQMTNQKKKKKTFVSYEVKA